MKRNRTLVASSQTSNVQIQIKFKIRSGRASAIFLTSVMFVDETLHTGAFGI